jgi:hypothetical protein
MTYFMASALEKGLQLASRILQASWLELIYDPLIIPVFSDPLFIILINKKNCSFTFIRVVIKILCHDHLHPNPSFLKLLPYVLSLYSGAASAPDFESAAYGSVLYFLEAVLPFLKKTAVLKVETDIIASITVSPIAVILMMIYV